MGFSFKLEIVSNQRIQTNEVTLDLSSSVVLRSGEKCAPLTRQNPGPFLLLCQPKPN